jgi:hypothetical protein
MPVEERFGGCTKKRANVDAVSIKLGEFYGAYFCTLMSSNAACTLQTKHASESQSAW